MAIRLLRRQALRAANAFQPAVALTLASAGLDGLVFASANVRLIEAAEIDNLAIISR